MPGPWSGYSNGQIPLSAMVAVRGEYFEPEAAAGMEAMEAAFTATWGYPLRIGEGYRSYETQVEYWHAYLNGTGNLAAYPGTSNHGFGQAADLWSHVDEFGTPQHDWAVANGPQYGWRWGSTPSEAWHFDFYPGTATAALDVTAIQEDEDDMAASRFVRHPNGSIALAAQDGTFIPLSSMDEFNALRGTEAVTDDEVIQLQDGFMWQLRTSIAARKSAQSSADASAVAKSLAPLIVPAVVDALKGVGGLTVQQVEDATEKAVKSVFADAAS